MWLKAVGSTTGANVDVWILTMASLRKVEKLSVRKQKLVLEFIAVIAGKTLRAPF
jgi:toxic protein SymE